MVKEETIYGRALAQAQEELRSISSEFERLAKKKAQLEAFIANAQPLVPVASSPMEFPDRPSGQREAAPPEKQPRIWKSILLSINGKGQSFNVKDVLEALDRIGRPVTSPNKYQIVRQTLKSKPEYFEKLEPGVYRVRKGLEEVGASEEAP